LDGCLYVVGWSGFRRDGGASGSEIGEQNSIHLNQGFNCNEK
jgi:hypothetical protein